MIRKILLTVSVLALATGYTAARAESQAEAAAAKGISSLPPEARSSISAALGRDIPGYRVRARGASFEATNDKQNLTADFTSRGVEVHAGSTRWGMRLRGYGYGDALAAVGDRAPRASANRVEYQRGSLTEWYVNGPLGLEQGFTISEPPGKRTGQDLTIALTLAGDLTAKVDQASKGLTLAGGNGAPSLRYTGLTARDADGRDLRAWLEVRGDRLLLRADDAGARYPVVIDPYIWMQLAELTDSDGLVSFGWSAAVSGSTVVVGAPGAAVGSHKSQGAVYVFVEPASGWANITQTAELTASDGAPKSELGKSVAISGDTVVAGDPYATVGSNEKQGAAYVFSKPASGWADMTQTVKLIASDGQASNLFGNSVAIGNGTVVVGARSAQIAGNSNAGAVYVFLQPGGEANKTENAKLTAADATVGQGLGTSVAISGNTIVAGAPGNDDRFNPEGAVYVFVEPAGGWSTMTSTAELTSTETSVAPEVGYSVAIDGNTVLAGAPYAWIGNNNSQGAAYLWVKPADGWTGMTETAKLYASNGESNDNFGYSVALESNTAVAGAAAEGRAYVFVEPATGWASTSAFTAELHASTITGGDYFGNSVGLSGDTLIVAALGATVGRNENQGAVYVFGKSQ